MTGLELIEHLIHWIKTQGDHEVIILTPTGCAVRITSINFYPSDQTIRITTE